MRDRHTMPSRGIRPSGVVLMRIEVMPSPLGRHWKPGDFQFPCELALHLTATCFGGATALAGTLSQLLRRLGRMASPKFGADLVRPILLPHDAEGGSVDAEADAVNRTSYGYVAD